MASGVQRRSTSRRSIILGEKLGLPKPFDVAKKDIAVPGRTSQIGAKRGGSLNPSQVSALSIRQSYQPGQSKSSMSRTSSIGGASLQLRKDPRNLTDKTFQHRSGKRLLSFLAEKGYPHSLSSQNLNFISKPEFTRMFNFLASFLHRSNAVEGKLEEEMPKKLKLMGYPFLPPKSCFKSVGTPHSWPMLLGILLWVIDKIHLSVEPSHYFAVDSEGFTNNESENVATFKMYCFTYDAFTKGGGAQSQRFRQHLDTCLQTREQCCENIRQTNQQLAQEVTVQEEHKASLTNSMVKQLQEKVKEVMEQKTQMENDIDQLQSQIQHRDQFLEQSEAVIRDGELELATLEEKQKNIGAQVQKQPISVEEARKLKEEECRLRYVIDLEEQETKRCYQFVSEFQMTHNRSLQDIDTTRQKINDKLRHLASLVASWCPTHQLQLIDYDTNERSSYEVVKSLMQQTRNIKAEINKVYEKISQKISSLENEIITAEEEESELASNLYSKQILNQELQSEVDRTLEDVQSKEEELNEAMKSDAAGKQDLEKNLQLVQKSVQETTSKLEELKRQQEEAELELAKLDDVKKEKNAKFTELLDICVSYVTASKDYYKQSRQNLSEAKREMKTYIDSIEGDLSEIRSLLTTTSH